jgi:hypothetical protein
MPSCCVTVARGSGGFLFRFLADQKCLHSLRFGIRYGHGFAVKIFNIVLLGELAISPLFFFLNPISSSQIND